MCYSAMIWADYRRYVREWDAANLDAQQAILDDRERPYYEHRLAA